MTLFLISLCLPCAANGLKTIPLISPAASAKMISGVVASKLPSGMPASKRWRPVTLARAIGVPGEIVPGNCIDLDLFNDASYIADVDRVDTNSNGTFTIRGRIEGYPLAYTLISTTGNRSLIEIVIPENKKRFIIQSDKSGSHYLIDVDTSHLTELEGGPSLVPPTAPSDDEDQAITAADSIVDDPLSPATVDVMVVYTPAARQWADTNGGGIANVIAQAMSKAQLACDNSNTVLTLRLAYSAEVSYTESGTSNTDLNRLTTSNDGYMDEIHSWRNQYSADLVTLLAKVDDTGGVGWLLSSTLGRPNYAFNLCRVQQTGWTYTVVHELGHNMGLHHAKSQNVQPGPGLFSYSAGWRWVGSNGSRYCSVMTYEGGTYFADGQTHTRVAYFSNPSIYHQNAATGDVNDGDNARTLRETKAVIAAYRTAPEFTTQPSNQTKYVGQTAAFTVIATGSAPLTYKWQKMPLNGNWTNIAGATSAYYATPSLTMAYNGNQYRVIVTNSVGGSATSNSATLTVNQLLVVPSAAAAKALEDGNNVSLSGKVITFASSNFFYIEDDNRVSGIRVEKSLHGLTVGMRANIIGEMKTNSDGERYILASSAVQTPAPNGTGVISAIGMNTRSIGGSDWSIVGTGGQLGVTDANGLNNIGLLVKIWGRFVKLDASTFTLDDGTGQNIRCTVPTGTVLNTRWRFISVVGVSSIYRPDSLTLQPSVLVRDISVISQTSIIE
ncbi:MAG: M12 family metallo-peptidase [Armatimonadota bacterium]|nr:M12 family metallo-peptidase [bacterium]